MEIIENVVMLYIYVGWGNELLLAMMFDSHDICREASRYALEMLNPWFDGIIRGQCRIVTLQTGVVV